jgi:serine/threonine protein phosphatase 1
MTYAISDIHGCYDKYRELLRAIRFRPEDTLYILGDVIDRGPHGFKILLDMAQRPNVIGLMGNHEAMAIQAFPGIMRSVRQIGKSALTKEETEALKLWFRNGGELSLADFLWLDDEPSRVAWEYMRKMPLYRETEVGGQKFVLVHGGLEHFSSSRSLSDYEPNEILWCRPEPDTVYYPDKYVVFGHTPVQLLAMEAGEDETPAKIYRKEKLIDIDCGCAFQGGRLGCLCLDTMEEVYV